MTKISRLLGITLLALLMACTSTPKGYTKDGWLMIKDRQPEFAKSIEWATATPERRAVREIINGVRAKREAPIQFWDQEIAAIAYICRMTGKDMKETSIEIYSKSQDPELKKIAEKLKKL